LARPASVARVALVSATSLVKTATTQTPRPVRGDHHPMGLIPVIAEFGLEDRDDEFARPLKSSLTRMTLCSRGRSVLGFDLGAGFYDGIDHPGGIS